MNNACRYDSLTNEVIQKPHAMVTACKALQSIGIASKSGGPDLCL